jgi:hypothetical protein
MTEPGYCRWPAGCSQPVSLVASSDKEKGLCFYHAKIVTGLIDVRGITPARGRARAQLKGSDVVSDEQREWAGILRKLDAPPEIVQRAMTKELSFGHGGKARHGSGTKRGRFLSTDPLTPGKPGGH